METDRGAALMASAYTEKSLWFAINCTIADPGEALRKQWFDGPRAPFSTFSAKITLGRIINIYGEGMEGRLNVVRRIRNQFAHAPRPIDFNHPAIQESCELLVPDDEEYERIHARAAYLASCLSIAGVLQHYGVTKPVEDIIVYFP
jgi:hypothetical protein